MRSWERSSPLYFVEINYNQNSSPKNLIFVLVINLSLKWLLESTYLIVICKMKGLHLTIIILKSAKHYPKWSPLTHTGFLLSALLCAHLLFLSVKALFPMMIEVVRSSPHTFGILRQGETSVTESLTNTPIECSHKRVAIPLAGLRLNSVAHLACSWPLENMKGRGRRMTMKKDQRRRLFSYPLSPKLSH